MLFKLKEMEYVEKIADKINSISLSGGGQLVDQLRQIFSTDKAWFFQMAKMESVFAICEHRLFSFIYANKFLFRIMDIQ